VFDAIVLTLLNQYLLPTDILGVLVAFRGIYLVLPLLVAILLLACHLLLAERWLPSKKTITKPGGLQPVGANLAS
jgi:hypothetical protein